MRIKYEYVIFMSYKILDRVRAKVDRLAIINNTRASIVPAMTSILKKNPRKIGNFIHLHGILCFSAYCKMNLKLIFCGRVYYV